MKPDSISTGGRTYRKGDPWFDFFSLPKGKLKGTRRTIVLLDVPLPGPARQQLSKALTLLDPPPAERESWRKNLHTALALREIYPGETDLPKRRGRPPNRRARGDVELARGVLEMCHEPLTTSRDGKWHRLSQLFADTKRDIRHHLDASLADDPPTAALAEKY
jgi:hypothetical protein